MILSHLDVLAVGNAIVDVFGQCEDDFLLVHGVEKGVMTLLDAEASAQLYVALKQTQSPELISGGSAANTAVGIAAFGGKANFVGRVYDDDLGAAFRKDIEASGVGFDHPPASTGSPTASSIILVTPDAARSMNTFLGASIELEVMDLALANAAAAKVIYLEGYLFDAPNGPAIFAEAAQIANRHGAKLALSLSDPWCVERHRLRLSTFISEHISILFGNEEELTSLAQCDSSEAILVLSGRVDELIVTRGPGGAFIGAGQECYEISAKPQGLVLDTTGAGDLFAAGYLFGRTNGFDLCQAGLLASLAAGEVITHIGARPQTDLRLLAENI